MTCRVTSARAITFCAVLFSSTFSSSTQTGLVPPETSRENYHTLQAALLNDSIYFDSFKGPAGLIHVRFPYNKGFKNLALDILRAPLSLEEKNSLWALFLLRAMMHPHITQKEWDWEKKLREFRNIKAAYPPREVLSPFKPTSKAAHTAAQNRALIGSTTGLAISLAIPATGLHPFSVYHSAGWTLAGGCAGLAYFWIHQAKTLEKFETCVETLFKTVKFYKKYLPVHLIESTENLKKECTLLHYRTIAGIDYQTLQTYIQQVLIFYTDLCTKAGIVECSGCNQLLCLPQTHPISHYSSHLSTGYGSTANR